MSLIFKVGTKYLDLVLCFAFKLAPHEVIPDESAHKP